MTILLTPAHLKALHEDRMARKVKARLHAIQQHQASAAQLSLLAALGDTQAAPATMAVASERIEALKAAQGGQTHKSPRDGS